MNSIERLGYYGNQIPQEREKTLPQDPSQAVWPSGGQIVFKKLEITYPSRPEYKVIKGIEITINAGEKIGVCGRAGSGKSTIASALLRLMEISSGAIIIDGYDIGNIGLETLRKGMQLIPQQPILFKGTVRSNLDPEKEFHENQLWEVLGLVGLKEYYIKQSARLQSSIEHLGSNLSFGQRQLICLARAILKKPKIVIMDEVTSFIDTLTEKKISSLIRSQFPDTTVISIAHRLQTLIEYDKILVIDDGKVVEFDTPNNLLSSNSSFLAMFGKSAQIDSYLS